MALIAPSAPESEASTSQASASGASAQVPARGHGRSRVRRAVLWVGGLVVPVWVLVAGREQLADAVVALVRADLGLLVAGAAAQAGALLALGQVYRVSLRAVGERVATREVTGVAVRAYALSRLLPGGGAAAALFAGQRLRRLGVGDGPAITAVVLAGLTTMLTLGGLVAAAGVWLAGSRPLAAVVAAAPAAMMAGLVAALGAPGVRAAIQRRAVRLPASPAAAPWREALASMGQRGPSTAQAVAAVGWSVLAWTGELVALRFGMAAVGATIAPDVAAVGLGAANAVTAVPHTPGGIGVVEGAMSAAFAGLGVPAATAIAGVVAYRVVAFWLPVMAGAGLLVRDGLLGGGSTSQEEAGR